MTAYLLQTALLLGLAYFVGCFLACMARSKLVAPPDAQAQLPDRDLAASAAVPIARTPDVSKRPVAPPPTIAPVRQAPAQPVATPVKDAFRRADTIAPVDKPAATPSAQPQQQASKPAATPASRFEQALSGVPKAAPTPAPAAVAAPVAAPAPAVAPVPAKAPMPANPSPVAAKPVAAVPAPSAPVAAPSTSSAAVAAAAAAAAASVAAAAAAASRQIAPVAGAPASVAPPTPPVAAVVIAPPAAQAPVAPAQLRPVDPVTDVTQAKPDDLKRIRSIDALLETSLHRIGIRRYSDIAKWRTEDVARVSQALGFKGRIEQENWIEQAQILTRGEETHYSRRLALGEQPSARPVSDEGTPKPMTPAAAPAVPAQPIRSRSGVEAAAAAAAAMAAAAAASRPSAAPLAAPAVIAPVVPPPAVVAPAAPAAVLAPATKPEVSERAAFANAPTDVRPGAPAATLAEAPKPAAPAMPAAPPIAVARPAPPVPAQPVPATPVAEAPKPAAVPAQAAPAIVVARPAPPVPAQPVPAVAAPAAAPPAAAPVAVAQASVAPAAQTDKTARPAIGSGRDNLQRIGGINSELEKLLNVQGVTRYSQIAHWAKPDIERFDRLFGQTGRVQRENWIEQAQILSKGGDTAYSREHDRRASEAARREEAAARPARLADAIRSNDVRPAEPDRARSSDLSSLRSVRSEAFRPSDAPASTVAGRSEQAAAMTARATGVVVPDDLKRIRGIGVLIEKKLNSMGVTSYTHVANWSAADIERISHVLDFKGRIERENWVEQARILAAGGQTEFSRKADRDGVS